MEDPVNPFDSRRCSLSIKTIFCASRRIGGARRAQSTRTKCYDGLPGGGGGGDCVMGRCSVWAGARGVFGMTCLGTQVHSRMLCDVYLHMICRVRGMVACSGARWFMTKTTPDDAVALDKARLPPLGEETRNVVKQMASDRAPDDRGFDFSWTLQGGLGGEA